MKQIKKEIQKCGTKKKLKKMKEKNYLKYRKINDPIIKQKTGKKQRKYAQMENGE